MSTILEIEAAVQRLSRNELMNFRDWFIGFDAQAWDGDSEEDAPLSAAASSEALAFLSDPAEDIYTTKDGVPFQNELPPLP